MPLAYISRPACHAFDPDERHSERPQHIAALDHAPIAQWWREMARRKFRSPTQREAADATLLHLSLKSP